MDEVAKHTPVSKALIAVVIALAVGMGIQSLLLYSLWKERRPLTSSPLFSALGAPPNGRAAPGARTQDPSSDDPFDEIDKAWNDWGIDGWNPMDEFRRMRREMDSLFDDSFGRMSLAPGAKSGVHAFAFSPNLDLQEKDGRYIARMDIPGADKNDLSVKLEDRVLTVSGQINESTETKDGNQVLRKERRSGSFKRSITLPGAVVADQLDARYENGVLTITIPKAKEETARKSIQIK
jgi:HSP20 family protein